MDSPREKTPAAALRAAAYNADLVTVRHLVREGVDVNVPDPWFRTALSLAAGEGHLEVVEFLLENGAWADPYEDYDTHWSPLIEAASKGRLEIVKVLLSAGANPHFHGSPAQVTAEFWARQNGHPAVAKYLRVVMGIEGE